MTTAGPPAARSRRGSVGSSRRVAGRRRSRRRGRARGRARAPCALPRHVRGEHGAGEAAAAAAAADGRHAGEGGRLEVVGGGVAARVGELEQRLDRRRDLRDLRLGRAASAHRDDHDAALAREQRGGVRRDRRLADALAGADDRRSRAAGTARAPADRSGSRRRRTGTPATRAPCWRPETARPGRGPARPRDRRRPRAGARRERARACRRAGTP